MYRHCYLKNVFKEFEANKFTYKSLSNEVIKAVARQIEEVSNWRQGQNRSTISLIHLKSRLIPQYANYAAYTTVAKVHW